MTIQKYTLNKKMKMTRNKTLNWGIMGAGIIARKMADALKLSSFNQLYSISSKNSERAKFFANEFKIKHSMSYEEIVNSEEIDVIYVATTHNFHYENTKLALEFGKNVLVEKPFTVNAQEAFELVKIARGKKLFLMEAIWIRFLPSLKKLKEIILKKEIGNPKVFNITFGNYVLSQYEKRLKDPLLAGGTTLDMGIYPISFVCYLLDELPIEIKSMINFSDSGVDEISHYMFRFPSNCIANISSSYNLKMNNLATIHGDQGFIELPNFRTGENFTISIHNGTNDIKESFEIFEKNYTNGFIYQVDEVAECIFKGEIESQIINHDETIGIMKVIDSMRSQWGLKYPFE